MREQAFKGFVSLTYFLKNVLFDRNLPRCFDRCCSRGIKISAELRRKNFRPQTKFSKQPRGVEIVKNIKNELDEDFREIDDIDDSLSEIIEESLYIHGLGRRVFIIQPRVKRIPEKDRLTTPELQLEEAVTLVKTLRTWRVVDTCIISVAALDKTLIFGPGQLENLRKMIEENSKIDAVFVNVNILKSHQQFSLQQEFRLPVFDRYNVVIQIFREHATTKEAKLQIKLAELPYLWSRLKSMKYGLLENFGGGGNALGFTWKGKEFHKQLLKQRESKIKEELVKLSLHRAKIRKNRIRNEIPIIAVVGYTNCGKTSLIKALTGREKLEPQDYLFATLDVTVHEGFLPCSMKVLFVDTIGFMSDLPQTLFQSFVSTLEDATIADLVIHVRDISHPDTIAQNENVRQTLKLLNFSERVSENILTVGNKIDLMKKDEVEKFKDDDDMTFVSAKCMIGTDFLMEKIEKYVLKLTNRVTIVMKVRTSNEEYCWLHENATIVNESPFPEDNQYMLMKVILTQVQLARFKHIFIKEYFNTKSNG